MLRRKALDAIITDNLDEEISLTESILIDDLIGNKAIYSTTKELPGREGYPVMAHAERSMVTTEGRSALIHALAHIERNAINWALNIVWHFTGMSVLPLLI